MIPIEEQLKPALERVAVGMGWRDLRWEGTTLNGHAPPAVAGDAPRGYVRVVPYLHDLHDAMELTRLLPPSWTHVNSPTGSFIVWSVDGENYATLTVPHDGTAEGRMSAQCYTMVLAVAAHLQMGHDGG
jgi:hypothetical protein